MKTISAAQPKLYIGIDIHKLSWKVHCVTDIFCGILKDLRRLKSL
ncbi:hypothetical protein LX95_01068 [Mesonia algae]|uniref:Transposase n=1 Tax=Mesonia algae TaxID=213248 RepID=A0A2W7I8L2_9FLAO|nr:hypothetical protein LX95_01068 [Mesonia algae]